MRAKKYYGAILIAIVLTVVMLKLSGFFDSAADSEKCIALVGANDIKAAVQPCTTSAEQGISSSQYVLGVMYDKGEGVTQDHKEAVRWYRKAADQGFIAAQYNLGYSYDTGNGVVADYGEAYKWYRMAAEQGYASAQYNLGRMYLDGRGVLKDILEAYAWFDVATTQGHQLAEKIRDFLAKNMTEVQLIEAGKLSLEYREKLVPSNGG